MTTCALFASYNSYLRKCVGGQRRSRATWSRARLRDVLKPLPSSQEHLLERETRLRRSMPRRPDGEVWVDRSWSSIHRRHPGDAKGSAASGSESPTLRLILDRRHIIAIKTIVVRVLFCYSTEFRKNDNYRLYRTFRYNRSQSTLADLATKMLPRKSSLNPCLRRRGAESRH